MLSRLPRWLLITLFVLLVVVLVGGLIALSVNESTRTVGLVASGVVVAVLIIMAIAVGPQLYRMYRFSKHLKAHEDQLNALPSLMQAGRTQEALARFDNVMKDAPDNAYIMYMKIHFLEAAGKWSEALTAANKALDLAGKDASLQMTLQQMGGQMGQPTTVEGFKAQVRAKIDELKPRVTEIRQRREKAAKERKKKSR